MRRIQGQGNRGTAEILHFFPTASPPGSCGTRKRFRTFWALVVLRSSRRDDAVSWRSPSGEGSRAGSPVSGSRVREIVGEPTKVLDDSRAQAFEGGQSFAPYARAQEARISVRGVDRVRDAMSADMGVHVGA